MITKNYFREILFVVAWCVGASLAASVGELSSSAARKLDPKLRSMVDNLQRQLDRTTPQPALVANAAGNWVRVLIKTSGSSEELRARGAHIISVIGDIAAAVVPIDHLDDLANLNDVVCIEFSKWLKLYNDVGTDLCGGKTAQQRFNLKGQGIIVGILDSGIDWQHADFRKADGTTRIKFILDLSDPGDTNGDGVLDGSGPFGGTLYAESQINAALNRTGSIAEMDRNGHGTHVTGSAAGNGLGTGGGISAGTYAGLAPEADIVFVKSQTGDLGKIPDTDIISALSFIDSVATQIRRPYVANFSFGTHEGPHDGTSLFEQAVDRFVGLNKPGKAIVVAAGNEGEKKIHAGGNMSGSAVTIDFNVPSFTVKPGTNNDYIYFDLWYSGVANLSFRLTSPNGVNYGPITSGNRFAEDTPNGAIIIDNAQAGVNPNNGDKQVMIQIFDFTSTRPPTAGNWKLTVTGSSGRYDLWLYNSSMGAELISNIDYSRLVAMPATATNIITVGAWITKTSWTDLDGHPFVDFSLTTGAAGTFSSPGPTRDNRIKPEINAPGQMIASSLSVDAPPNGPFSIWRGDSQFPNASILRDNRHAIGAGTSFSAALVTGGIALMLQKSPQANAIQIRNALLKSAKADQFTETVPNNKWGYGKVDFVGAINSLVTVVEADKNSIALPQKFVLSQNYPNPFNRSTEGSQRSPATTIRYTLPFKSQVVLAVYDLSGCRVALLDFGHKPAGEHRAIWDGRDHVDKRVASGIYFYRLEAKFSTGSVMILTRKMMVLQ